MIQQFKSKFTREEINISSLKLKRKIVDLIQEGSVHHVVIFKGEKPLLEIPLIIGLGSSAAAILLHAPLTAVCAITALVSNVKIVVYRKQ